MRDRPWILLGLALFTALVTFPLWYNTVLGVEPKELELEKARGDACIYETAYMRERHMDVLMEWRDEVVRRGNRLVKIGGKTFEMSLTKTCLDCHRSKERFCDRCHDYAAVTPYCWDCHVAPEQGRVVAARARTAGER